MRIPAADALAPGTWTRRGQHLCVGLGESRPKTHAEWDKKAGQWEANKQEEHQGVPPGPPSRVEAYFRTRGRSPFTIVDEEGETKTVAEPLLPSGLRRSVSCPLFLKAPAAPSHAARGHGSPDHWWEQKAVAQLFCTDSGQAPNLLKRNRLARAAVTARSADRLAACLQSSYLRQGQPLRVALEEYFGHDQGWVDHEIDHFLRGLNELKSQNHLLGYQLPRGISFQPRNNPLFSLLANVIGPAAQVDTWCVHFPVAEHKLFQPILDALCRAVQGEFPGETPPPVDIVDSRQKEYHLFFVRGETKGAGAGQGSLREIGFARCDERMVSRYVNEGRSTGPQESAAGVDSGASDREGGRKYVVRIPGTGEIWFRLVEGGGVDSANGGPSKHKDEHDHFVEQYCRGTNFVVHTGNSEGAGKIHRKVVDPLHRHAVRTVFNGSGVNPVVVRAPDVQRAECYLRQAAASVGEARAFYRGQDCGAPDAILVYAPQMECFRDALISWLQAHGRDAAVRLRTEAAWQKLKTFLDEQWAHDPKSIVLGGRCYHDCHRDDKGNEVFSYWMEPTVIVQRLEDVLQQGRQRPRDERHFEEHYAPIYPLLSFQADQNNRLLLQHPKYMQSSQKVCLFYESEFVRSHFPPNEVIEGQTVIEWDEARHRYGGSGSRASGVLTGASDGMYKPIHVMEQLARHALTLTLPPACEARATRAARKEADLTKSKVQPAFSELFNDVDQWLRKVRKAATVAAFMYRGGKQTLQSHDRPYHTIVLCRDVAPAEVQDAGILSRRKKERWLHPDPFQGLYAGAIDDTSEAAGAHRRGRPGGEDGGAFIPLADNLRFCHRLPELRPAGQAEFDDADGVSGLMARIAESSPYAGSTTTYMTEDELAEFTSRMEAAEDIVVDTRGLRLIDAFGIRSNRTGGATHWPRAKAVHLEAICDAASAAVDRFSRSATGARRQAMKFHFSAVMRAVDKRLKHASDRKPDHGPQAMAAFVCRPRTAIGPRALAAVRVFIACWNIDRKALQAMVEEETARQRQVVQQGRPPDGLYGSLLPKQWRADGAGPPKTEKKDYDAWAAAQPPPEPAQASAATGGLAGLLDRQDNGEPTPGARTEVVSVEALEALLQQSVTVGATAIGPGEASSILDHFGDQSLRDGECVFSSDALLSTTENRALVVMGRGGDGRFRGHMAMLWAELDGAANRLARPAP